jgi:hypothetical protein
LRAGLRVVNIDEAGGSLSADSNPSQQQLDTRLKGLLIAQPLTRTLQRNYTGGTRMGNYVQNSLIAGETLEQEANVTLLSQALYFILALLTIPTIVLPILFVLIAVINVKTTELAVTNKKVIGKSGWIARKSIDLPLSKLESFTIDESLLGRILGYGKVQISGTGGHRVAIPYIKAPHDFKRVVMSIQDALARH